MIQDIRLLRRRSVARSAYAKSWRSQQREPLVKKSAASLWRGLSVLIWDEDINEGIRRE